MIASITGAAVFALLAYRARVLDGGGSVAAGLFGATLLLVGGVPWIAPAATFFVLSSALSRVVTRRKREAAVRAEKGGRRDAAQVLANGGVGWMLLLVHAAVPAPVLYWSFVGAFAAAAADTWATEIGTLVGGRPRLVTTGRAVPPGTSGAASAAGTAGAAAGAATVWAAAAVSYPPLAGAWAAAAILGAGLVGMLTDSLLGATVQVQYRDPRTGEHTERPSADGHAFERVRGVSGWDNDRVNLVGTAFGASAAALAAWILGPG